VREGLAGIEIDTRRPARENLHVLTLTPFYPSGADDANGCFVAELLEWLGRLGVRNTVIALQPFYRGRLRGGNSAVPVQWLRYFSLPGGLGLPTAGQFAFARIASRLKKLHRTRRIDVIHAHGALPCGHAAMLASKELQLPFIVSVHGLDVFSTLQVKGSSGERCRQISRLIYGSANHVICVSDHVRAAILEGMADTCRTSVIYNGVDPGRFMPTSTITPDGQKILSVGNLISIKGHEHLIRAIASLSQEFPSVALDIIGEGPERESLEALARNLQLAGKVNFLGRQSRAQVAEAMRNCNIFALPSRYEGLGCVYIEAMSCAKPAIGCRGQGIAEIIQEGTNGFLVDPENEPELAAILATLLRDPARSRDIGKVARETILGRLTLRHQSVKLMEIYRECLQ
jgi:glycosyltransferase involved in cell wall biosynthesis